MCGICGKLSFNSSSVSPELIRKMNSKLFHRGPDEEGLYFSPEKNFGMGIRRLKVIDLSTGSQPVMNETKDIIVILNGEIYNYIELRTTLEEKGHTFSTRSDTETIVHAYEEHGIDFLSRLNGMFALALWDHKKKKLILARDRLGIKPFYYRQNQDGISFSSEIKSLLADPECAREVDPLALDDYFSLLYVPGPRSIFKSIQKLEPGHALICDWNKKTVQNRTYWERLPIQETPDLGWDTYQEHLDLLFKDSLKLQLRSDVPNGVFLSSGLDSGAIAYYASRVSSKKIKTFTVHFGTGSAAEDSYNEREGARLISEVCGSDHEEITLNPNAQDLILKTTDFFDEPFADNSAIPTYLLCQFARKKITVALSGEGGDELFAGYPTYLATRFSSYYRKAPSWMRRTIAQITGKIPVSWNRLSWDFKLKQFVHGAQFEPERAHFAWKEIFSEEEKTRLYQREFLSEKNGHDGFESFEKLFKSAGSGTELEKLLFVDQNTYLLDQFLVKSDRMSMAHSLEVRVPILDHRLVEYAAKIPRQYKMRGMTTKWTLRKLMEGKLPKEILWGSKKGFSPPVPSWIAGDLKPFVKEVLSPGQIQKTGFIRPDYAEKLLEEHFNKQRDNHRRIWALMNFVLWFKKWA